MQGASVPPEEVLLTAMNMRISHPFRFLMILLLFMICYQSFWQALAWLGGIR